MNRNVLQVALIMVFVSCVGCARDFYARQLVQPDTGRGKLSLMLTGTGEQLVKRGKIDLARQFKMSDGVTIDVWVIRGKAPKPVKKSDPLKQRGTVVAMHGLCESKASMLGLGERLAQMGYDVVLPDLRTHGKSTGKYITYGVKESRDVKTVVDTLLAEKAVRSPVYVYGVTLGGTVAIQYAAIEPACKGVLAMTPYKDARSIARRSIAALAPMMSPEDFEATLERAGEMADFNPAEASAVKAAARLQCPLHLICGLVDLSVPAAASNDICNAAPEPKKLTVIAPHEQIVVAAILDRWIADRIDELAKGKLKTEPPK
ncbi:MAG: alpha/beta fold hydrolase [Planctomycetota bacterium]|nr:alpha/beta fold hydrolase [Planctomycetota bacterium]